MKFYLVDDDMTVIKMVANLIEDNQLGNVVGRNTNPISALDEIGQVIPDICLVDMLMPEMNGNSFIKKVKEKYPSVSFIMISQVSAGEMVSEAYEKGATFYLHKPINAIEFRSVVQSVAEKITMQRALDSIKGVLGEGIIERKMDNQSNKGKLKVINKILGELGILGEKGTYDLQQLCEGLLEKAHWNEGTINSVIRTYDDNPKTVKQRMRRAISKGLSNIAHSGIEDYLNDHFVKYSHTLFDFQCVKEEMDYIRLKRNKGGKASLSRFIEGLLLLAEEH